METEKTFSPDTVPWQIWIVVCLLGLEGMRNCVMMFSYPVAASWLAAKVIFIIGLLRKWKWLYIICIAIVFLHVVYFAIAGAIFISLTNLALEILLLSVKYYYFPKQAGSDSTMQKA